ncbi:MAG: hypothetical protein HY645_13440 [Acidobacteria bacterium]|nr:hypothetical protein [Acidobacteriota bacterium]
MRAKGARLSVLVCAFFAASTAFPQNDNDREDFRVEVTGYYWALRPSGQINTNGQPIDLESDLGLGERTPHFVGKLVAKPARKHRILFEFIPYRLDGQHVLSRQIRFAGRDYAIRERITSSAEINSVFAGYQYDFVSREQGHFGVLVGAAYMDAKARAASESGVTGSQEQSVPFPVVGVGFRGFPSHNELFNINGEVRGMSFGSYGRIIQATFNAGFSIGSHFTFQAGYMILDADLHDKGGSDAIKPRFSGPVFSVQVRDR